MTLSLDTAYRSFGGEVEASSTPTICRLPDSRRHQLWAIAREQLMANALGVTDREAMHGILRQLVRASVSGESADEVNLSFMISMVKSIKPRDSIEAMLVAQMVSVHVMAMRCAHHLANADDLAQHDSAARALSRLARTFPAQIEALNRYRSHGEPAITVQNLSVGDGGKSASLPRIAGKAGGLKAVSATGGAKA